MVASVFTLAPIVSRLQSVVSIPFVGGMSDFTRASEQASMEKGAFVLPISEQSSANQSAVLHTQQQVIAMFRVVFLVRNYGDASGGTTMDSMLATMRIDALTALLGFTPQAQWEAIEHTQGALLKAENGAIWWQDDFKTGFYRSSV